ncbi:MAG: hypothetical protein A2168_08535 [Planctomycetes bacterium RBG_13_50_24]|nr:MAG: hypothetical protein A2168_08535 [Planctomycetes bacterium RBG_13_50_24]
MKKYNPRLQAAIFEVVDNQMSAGDPPETKETFERLLGEGFSKEDVKKLIGQAICVEIYCIGKYREEFDRERYIRNLRNLPKEPEE